MLGLALLGLVVATSVRADDLMLHVLPTNMSNAVRVVWTASVSTPTVRWGVSEHNLTHTVVGTNTTYTIDEMCGPPASDPSNFVDPGQLNWATLQSLPDNEDVFYSVLTTDGFSAPFRLHRKSDGMSFLVVGDLGTTGAGVQSSQAIQAAVLNGTGVLGKSPMPNLVEIVGDLSYSMGRGKVALAFDDMIQPWASHVPVAVIPGNHDTDDSNCSIQWCPPWGTYEFDSGAGGECGVVYERRYPMDGLWWVSPLRSGGVEYGLLVGVSTEHDFLPGSEQYSFLQAQMSQWRKANPSKWLIVTQHRPIYDATPTALLPEEAATRQALEPLYASVGVDLVLEAHIHVYMRTCSIYNSTCVSDAAEDDAHSNSASTSTSTSTSPSHSTYHRPLHFSPELHETTGRPVVCVGNGGKDSGLRFWIDDPAWLRAKSLDFGVSRIDLSPTKLSFLNVANNGTLLDSFDIQKKE